MRNVALVAWIALLLAACGGDGASRAASGATTSPVTGLVVALDGDTMELEVGGRLAGERVTFQVADPYLPPGHLQEHLDQRLPVRVHFERRGDVLAATVIEDA